jgi:hypothetical protein
MTFGKFGYLLKTSECPASKLKLFDVSTFSEFGQRWFQVFETFSDSECPGLIAAAPSVSQRNLRFSHQKPTPFNVYNNSAFP